MNKLFHCATDARSNNYDCIYEINTGTIISIFKHPSFVLEDHLCVYTALGMTNSVNEVNKCRKFRIILTETLECAICYSILAVSWVVFATINSILAKNHRY